MTTPATPPGPDQPDQPGQPGRKVTDWPNLVGGIIVAVLIVGIVVSHIRGNHDDDQAAAPATTSTPVATSPYDGPRANVPGTENYTDAHIYALEQGACNDFTNGNDWDFAVQDAVEAIGTTYYGAGYFISHAVGERCPQYESLLP